jgi:hypothetical protein
MENICKYYRNFEILSGGYLTSTPSVPKRMTF